MRKGYDFILLVFLSAGVVLSCNTLKYKSNFVDKQFRKIEKYNAVNIEVIKDGNDNTESHSSLRFLLSDSTLRVESFRKIKMQIGLLEYEAALIPDSVDQHNIVNCSGCIRIDSFYSNRYKIRFIKKKRISRANLHFLQ